MLPIGIMKSVCDVTNPYNTVGIYEMRGRRMVVHIWHLILLADITVCYCKRLWGILQDTHLQVTFWMQIKCV